MLIVGICGGSGSGKTTLLNQLSSAFDGIQPTIFSMDNYYKSIDNQIIDENGIPNFDLPTALDFHLLAADLRKLLAGETIAVKEYAFNVPMAEQRIIQLQPSSLIIIEGIFLFYFETIRKLLDFSIFIDVPLAVQLERRLKRDTITRGYSEEDVLYQWNNHVLPSYEHYVHPYSSAADFKYSNINNDPICFQELVDLIKVRLN